MVRKITMAKVNGVGAVMDADGNYRLPRKVLERNVLDMLEENEKYLNLPFLDAQEFIEQANEYDLIRIYTEEMTTEEFTALYKKTTEA